jgi:hypothetical protein
MKITIFSAILYFLLSTLITWWFIESSPLYISTEQMVLSCTIAGGKWLVQLVAAFFILKEKKWIFIKYIGYTCFVGSVILIPNCISSTLNFHNSSAFFIGSLIFSVLLMISLYYQSAKKSKVSIKWFYGWLICLAIAITLQLTLVFNIL